MDLENEIFGGGDSDLSDIEEDAGQQAAPSRSASPASAGGYGGRDEEGGEDEDEGDRRQGREGTDEDYDGDGDYVAAGRLPSFKRAAEGDEERVEGEEVRRKKKKKHRTTEQVQPEEDPQAVILDPAAQRKKILNDKIDAIIKPMKGKKRKRKGDDEDINIVEEEEVSVLELSMKNAAASDTEAVSDGRPAVHKLQMLPQVVKTLQKAHLQDFIQESTVLTQVKVWLEPIGEDHSLPAVNIQRSLIDILAGMNLDTQTVKSNELGKIINFYTKCKRVDPAIRRSADRLVTNWMRPILRRSAMYRDRVIESAPMDVTEAQSSQPTRTHVSRTRISNLIPPAETEIAKRHARVPQGLATAFSVQPRSRIEEDEGGASVAGRAAAVRFRGFSKKLVASKNDARRI